MPAAGLPDVGLLLPAVAADGKLVVLLLLQLLLPAAGPAVELPVVGLLAVAGQLDVWLVVMMLLLPDVMSVAAAAVPVPLVMPCGTELFVPDGAAPVDYAASDVSSVLAWQSAAVGLGYGLSGPLVVLVSLAASCSLMPSVSLVELMGMPPRRSLAQNSG